MIERHEWVYWGDRKMWSLADKQRRALQLGRITPREARVLYDLHVLAARAFWRQVERGEITLASQAGSC